MISGGGGGGGGGGGAGTTHACRSSRGCGLRRSGLRWGVRGEHLSRRLDNLAHTMKHSGK